MSPERKLERDLLKYCKAKGVYCRKFVSPGHAGVPDRILVGAAGIAFLELKSPGKRPTKLQAREMELIRKAGGRAFWCDSLHGARAVVDAVRAADPVKLIALDVMQEAHDLVPIDTGTIRRSIKAVVEEEDDDRKKAWATHDDAD